MSRTLVDSISKAFMTSSRIVSAEGVTVPRLRIRNNRWSSWDFTTENG